ncbi:DUF6541 family protein [Actinomycetospora sp. TBRC 11914]|uniref:DUF6541 family protein n=1 Tax=Actinomycetospora sp. TBRC 11914 TaxID=2729387 RepID=UPI00145D32AB|nr:DUF6541 family protein [Actinomycetospora sp. TBRC 11914]NMO90073.1 hypothetical protein [Actinomycetospora sp. TBRC 11914]
MVPETLAVVVALLVVLVPGSAALVALGVGRPLWVAVLAAPSSVAVASVTGVVTGVVGARFGVVALGVASFLLAAVGVLRLVLRTRGRVREVRPRRTRRAGAAVLGVATVAVAVVVSVLTWLGGFGWSLRTYPQEHDMIFHLALSSYIARTGVGAPWELAPTDVLTGGGVLFYPAGLHLLAAVVTQLTGSVVVAVNALALVLVGVGFPLALAVLTAALGRAAGYARDSAAGAGGVAAVLAATMYRPGVQLAHDGGILPNAVAFTLAALVLAALVSWRRVPRAVLLGAGVAAAGAAAVHPSALVTIGVTAVVYLAVDVLRHGRRDLARFVRAFWPAAVLGVVVALPTLLAGSSAVAATTAFVTATPNRPVALAVGKALTFAYGGYLDPDSARSQVAAAALVLGGVLVLVVARRCGALLVAAAVWLLVVVSYFVGPGKGPAGIVTGFFYNSEPRVWSHLTLLGVPAGALGLALAARWIARRVPGRTPALVPWVTSGLLLLLVALYAVGPGYGYARIDENAVASRFTTPDFTRVDADDEAAAAWLAGQVRPGQRILNSANDGSTILYTEYGLPIVNLATLGSASAPYTYQLLGGFRDYPRDPVVRRDLRDLDVDWLYVDSRAPAIGVGGAPFGWPQADRLTVPRGFEDLDGLPGLTAAFRAGTVTVYRLDPAVVARL